MTLDVASDRKLIPWTTTIALVAMIATVCLVTVRMIQAALDAVGRDLPQAHIVALVIALAVGATPAIIAAWALWRAQRLAPLMVTVAAIWAGFLLVQYEDLLSASQLVVSAVAVTFAWMPSARKFSGGARARPTSTDPSLRERP